LNVAVALAVRGPATLTVEPNAAVPVTFTLPGNETVFDALPIVTPVAVEVPIEIVLEPSMTTGPLPEILVLVNVSYAKAIDATPRVAAMMREMTTLETFLLRDAYMDSWGCIYVNNRGLLGKHKTGLVTSYGLRPCLMSALSFALVAGPTYP
jgi:hypothetical protein